MKKLLLILCVLIAMGCSDTDLAPVPDSYYYTYDEWPDFKCRHSAYALAIWAEDFGYDARIGRGCLTNSGGQENHAIAQVRDFDGEWHWVHFNLYGEPVKFTPKNWTVESYVEPEHYLRLMRQWAIYYNFYRKKNEEKTTVFKKSEGV